MLFSLKGSCLRLTREVSRRFRVAFALLWILLHPKKSAEIKSKNIWLFGCAGGSSFDDNSAALFKYMREKCTSVNVIWIIDKNSPDIDIARLVGPILFYNDISAYIYGALAKVHVVSHGLHDIPTMAYNIGAGAFKVKLGHGLTAFKGTTTKLGMSLSRTNEIYDLVPVASEFEKENKKTWGISPNNIKVTGLARFDTLMSIRKLIVKNNKRIVYMPTWRDGDYHNTEMLYGEVEEMVTNTNFIGILRGNDISMDIVVHRNLDTNKVKNIVSKAGGVVEVSGRRVQECIAECGCFITDYSSVAWDALYLDIPTIFARFGRRTDTQRTASQIEEGEVLFGPIVESIDQLGEAVEALVTRGVSSETKARMRSWQAKAFAYRDDQNAARVAAEIMRGAGERAKEMPL